MTAIVSFPPVAAKRHWRQQSGSSLVCEWLPKHPPSYSVPSLSFLTSALLEHPGSSSVCVNEEGKLCGDTRYKDLPVRVTARPGQSQRMRDDLHIFPCLVIFFGFTSCDTWPVPSIKAEGEFGGNLGLHCFKPGIWRLSGMLMYFCGLLASKDGAPEGERGYYCDLFHIHRPRYSRRLESAHYNSPGFYKNRFNHFVISVIGQKCLRLKLKKTAVIVNLRKLP